MDLTKGYTLLKKSAGWKIIFDKTECNELMLNQIEKFISLGIPPKNWIQLKSSYNSKVWKFPANNRWYVFKKYLNRSALDNIKAAFTNSRAKKAWVEGLNLINRGFATPKMPICGEKLFFCIPTHSFLITEFLPDSYGIYTILKDRFNTPLTSGEIKLKRSIMHSLGKFIGKLHAKGIVHGDLRLDNIIVSGWKKNGHKFYLIDNERNKYFSKGIPARLREKNLIQINMIVMPHITFTDRLRFFNAYLNENPELKPAAKDWISKVFLKTMKRLQKKTSGLWAKD